MTTTASTARYCLRFALALYCLAAMLVVAPRSALAVDASPDSFVPAWDGVTDATSISWQVTTATRVRVLVVGVDGRARRVLVDAVQQPGTHSVWWDGRDGAGRLLPSGRWLIRVEQGAASAKPAPVTAAGRAATVKATADEVAVTLQEAPVAIREVKLVRGSIGSSSATSTARASVDVSAPATLAAAVVDGDGGVVRSLRSGTVKAGTTGIVWDGRDGNGRPAADGAYTLLVAASGSGRPTNTIRTPLRVDRTPPALVAKRAVRAATSRTNVTVPMVVRVDEAATIAVRSGKQRITWKQQPGSRKVTLRGDLLGIRPAKVGRTVKLLVLAADTTGNARAATVTVVVPKVASPAPAKQPVSRAPVTSSPTPAPPATPAGKLRWPVVNIVTSEFGMRWGRPHQGLDINAPTGTAVYAAAAGTVLSAGTMDGYGIQVTLQHANGLSTRYAHFSATALGLVAGDTVNAGQLIGLSGCTGSCTGPHVHFETRVDGVAKNPRLFLG